MNQVELANTILGQIKAGIASDGITGGVVCMRCWAFQYPTALPAGKYLDDYQLGGLRFRVSGFKFKGYVFVRVMANDTYTVEFSKLYKGEYNVKKSYERIYCDQLTSIIDSEVESDDK